MRSYATYTWPWQDPNSVWSPPWMRQAATYQQPPPQHQASYGYGGANHYGTCDPTPPKSDISLTMASIDVRLDQITAIIARMESRSAAREVAPLFDGNSRNSEHMVSSVSQRSSLIEALDKNLEVTVDQNNAEEKNSEETPREIVDTMSSEQKEVPDILDLDTATPNDASDPSSRSAVVSGEEENIAEEEETGDESNTIEPKDGAVVTLPPEGDYVDIFSSCIKIGMPFESCDSSWGPADSHRETLENLENLILQEATSAILPLNFVGLTKARQKRDAIFTDFNWEGQKPPGEPPPHHATIFSFLLEDKEVFEGGRVDTVKSYNLEEYLSYFII